MIDCMSGGTDMPWMGALTLEANDKDKGPGVFIRSEKDALIPVHNWS